MGTAAINQIASRAIFVGCTIAVPILAVCLIVGIIISIFQATTQIHEQSLAFVPKVIAVVALLAIAGSWMVGQLLSFTREAFSMMSSI